MKPALLACIAIVFTTGKGFSQQTVKGIQTEAETVVTNLYKRVIFLKPLGLPQGKELEAIRPSLSQDLLARIRVAGECEKDYFRQYPDPDPKDPNAYILKPPFAWMETGLFSGGNEQADPFWFGVRRSESQKDGSYEVRVKLKRWPEPDKYPRARGPMYDWTWEVVVFVIRDGNHLAVNDIYYPQVYPDNGEPRYPTVEKLRLSQLLGEGCKDGKWVGYSDR